MELGLYTAASSREVEPLEQAVVAPALARPSDAAKSVGVRSIGMRVIRVGTILTDYSSRRVEHRGS